MNDILKLARIQIWVIVTFVINKLVLRPYILEHDFPELFNIFVLSYSNFCEAVVGTISLTYIGLIVNQRWNNLFNIKEIYMYVMATILAAVFVITQEFKIHNLGGQNVYDPYDVLFSLIGLVAAFILLVLLKPKVSQTTPLNEFQ